MTDMLKQERNMMIKALVEAQGNKSIAAKLVGMKRTTFITAIKRLKITQTRHEVAYK